MSSDVLKTFKLEEVAEIVGGGTPSTTNSDYWGGDIPWLTPRDLSTTEERFVTRGERNISRLGLENSSAKLLPTGTVLLTTRAPIGYLAIASNPICTNQGFKSLIPNEQVVDSVFLYYLLKNNVEYLKSVGVGTTFAEISGGALRQIELKFPDLSVQHQIAEILSVLDDKIELNRKTNQTLEGIAQAIFKEWFIDFNYPGATGEMIESPLGPIPKGWKAQEIGNLFSFVIGGDWGKEELSSEFSEECRVIRGTDLDNVRIGDVSDIPIRFIKKTSLEKRKINEGDIVFEISGGSRDQSTGRNQILLQDTINLLQLPVIPTSFCRLIRTENIWTSIFLSTYLSIFYKNGGPWDYQLQSTGISNFQFTDFSKRHLIISPPEEAIIEFFNLVYPMYKCIDILNIQSASLSTIRDLLLPRLISGEIEV